MIRLPPITTPFPSTTLFRSISLDEPVQAQPLPEPPAPVEAVAVPEVLPMPAQLKPAPEGEEAKPAPEPVDEKVRVSRANTDRKSTRLKSSHLVISYAVFCLE